MCQWYLIVPAVVLADPSFVAEFVPVPVALPVESFAENFHQQVGAAVAEEQVLLGAVASGKVPS